VTPLARTLLRWHERNGRADLPWRRRRSAYRTLVSEFMLQQTQVDRVVPSFERFVARFPTLAALAAASPGDVMREWRGLGYNARALRLHAVAREIVENHRARIPKETATLRAMPGIGRYTAAAIRAFAYDLPDAAVDTNARRVLHRLAFGIEHPPRASLRELETLAHTLVPPGRSHDWNAALMDLGSRICTARAPKCSLCPLRRRCAAAPLDAAALERARAKHLRRPKGEAVPFAQSARHARGRIVDRLRDLPPGQRISLLDLHRELRGSLPQRSPAQIRALVDALAGEGLVCLQDDNVGLP
jgi:A/G-specific adenine glycosylase